MLLSKDLTRLTSPLKNYIKATTLESKRTIIQSKSLATLEKSLTTIWITTRQWPEWQATLSTTFSEQVTTQVRNHYLLHILFLLFYPFVQLHRSLTISSDLSVFYIRASSIIWLLVESLAIFIHARIHT